MNDTINEALNQAQDLMALEGVEGVAQGEKDGQPCILIFTSHPAAEIRPQLPETLAGFPVVVQETGPFQAQ